MVRHLFLCFLASLPALAETAKKPDTRKTGTAKTESKAQGTKKPDAKKPAANKTPSASSSAKKPQPEKPAAATKSPEKPEGDEPLTEGKEAGKSPHGKPALIATADLTDFDALPNDRKKLIEGAISVAKESPWLPYKFGGSSPADGGFDCSGAMYFVMNKAGLKPPRTSADQYLWLKENNRLHEAAADARAIDHPSLAALRPGDLLFWSGTYAPSDGRTVNITHVAIYLGKEKKGNRPVMINATDGRSYRGTQANGYGVYDFYLPKEGSRSAFVGFGTPPGVAEMTSAAGATPTEVTSP